GGVAPALLLRVGAGGRFGWVAGGLRGGRFAVGVETHLVRGAAGLPPASSRLAATGHGADPEARMLVVVLRHAAEITVATRHVLPALAPLLAGVGRRLRLTVDREPGLAVAILADHHATNVPGEGTAVQHV